VSDDAPDPAKPDREAAMIVALELLRTAVADLRTSLAENATRVPPVSAKSPEPREAEKTSRDLSGKPPDSPDPRGAAKAARDIAADLARSGSGGDRKDGGGGAAAMLLGKFAAVLGPLALFGQILQSNAAGFQVLGSAVQVLAAVLAPIFLPVVLALAGALLDMSEDIQNSLLPGIQEWTRLIFGVVVPVLGELVSMFRAVIDTLADFMLAVAYAADEAWSEVDTTADDIMKSVADLAPGDGDFSGDAGAGGSIDAPVRPAGAAAAGPPAAGGRRGLDDVIRSFTMSIGAKAQFTGLAQIGSQQQLAGLNGDPIQQRMLDALLRTAAGIEGARADARRAEAAPMAPR
jgi:hypothetical protein